MNINDLNAVLGVSMILCACGGVILWLSPAALTNAALRLNARSKALTAARNAYRAVHGQVMQTASADNAKQQPLTEINNKRQTPAISS